MRVSRRNHRTETLFVVYKLSFWSKQNHGGADRLLLRQVFRTNGQKQPRLAAQAKTTGQIFFRPREQCRRR